MPQVWSYWPFCEKLLHNKDGKFSKEGKELPRRWGVSQLGSPKNVPIPDLSVDLAQLIRLQNEDKTLKRAVNLASVGEKNASGQPGSSFVFKNSLLYRWMRREDGDMIDHIVVPEPLRKSVLALAHDGLLAGHGGVQRTLDRIYSNLFLAGSIQGCARILSLV